MRKTKKRLTMADMVEITFRTRNRIDEMISTAEKLKHDPDRKNRLKQGYCQACYYLSFLGGAAITDQPCSGCGKVVTYASTDTNVLCDECAKQHRLCKRCGADLDLRTRRRKWPKFENQGD